VRLKEQIERLVEDGEVVVPVDEQAAKRPADVLAAGDAYPLERTHGIEEPAVMHVEPRRAKHAAKQQHVAGESGFLLSRRHDVPASARLRIACSRSPRTL
jgi:hypothetical protein